jgi:hypothetical protein
LNEGLKLSREFKYQFLDHLFSNINNKQGGKYIFNYDYYELDGLEGYVKRSNEELEKRRLINL